MATLFGDTTGSLSGKQLGGDQTLVGTDPTNTIYGDAGQDLLDFAQGGNDTLITFGFGSLYGDAGGNIADHAIGGNDTLQANIIFCYRCDNTLNMFGDAGGDLLDHAVAGDDNLNAQLA